VNSPDFLVIGHVAKDLVGDGYRLGGTAAYAALTARNLGRKVAMVTSAGPDLQLKDCLKDVEVLCLPSPTTTTFVNLYTAGQRQQYIRSVAESIPPEAIPAPWRQTAIVLLGPIASEFDAEMIDLFPASLLGLTPQGWLRQWDESGRVSPRRWAKARGFLPQVDAFFVSEDDMAGEASELRSLLGLPRLAVVTQGARGATLHSEGQTSRFPARPAEMVDPTGAGDIFAAAFLVRLAETDDAGESTRFANVAASLSVEKAGLASVPQRAQIERERAGSP